MLGVEKELHRKIGTHPQHGTGTVRTTKHQATSHKPLDLRIESSATEVCCLGIVEGSSDKRQATMGKSKGGIRIKQVGPKAPAMAGNPMDAFQIPPTEMIQLPPPPDRSYMVIWPISETFTMDTDSFQVIYPSYLDSKKTVKEGRRIPSSLAVPTPTVSDISLALQALQVRHVLQPYKGYSRDCLTLWDNPGRVKVDISQHTKKELLRLIAAAMPTVPGRAQRLERETAEAAAVEEKLLAEKQELAKSAAPKKKLVGATGKKKGKKGKKK